MPKISTPRPHIERIAQMADGITIEIDSAPVRDALNRLLVALGADGMTPAMKEIGEVLTESSKQRFATSTAPDGTRWAPNAQATFESYLNRDGKNFRQDGRLGAKGAARAMNKKQLVDSGLLADSSVWQIVADGAGVDVGTNRFAGEWDGGAAVHQFGNRKGTIPARLLLGVSATDEVAVLEIVERHLLGALGGLKPRNAFTGPWCGFRLASVREVPTRVRNWKVTW